MEYQQDIYNIITKHLNPVDHNIFVFGSRAQNTHRKWSDIDVGIQGKQRVPHLKMALIKSDLEDSDIPYHVDIVDFQQTDKSFKNIALQHIIPLV